MAMWLYVRGRGACGHYRVWRDASNNLWSQLVSWEGTAGVPRKFSSRTDALRYLVRNTNQPQCEVERVLNDALGSEAEDRGLV